MPQATFVCSDCCGYGFIVKFKSLYGCRQDISSALEASEKRLREHGNVLNATLQQQQEEHTGKLNHVISDVESLQGVINHPPTVLTDLENRVNTMQRTARRDVVANNLQFQTLTVTSEEASEAQSNMKEELKDF